MGSGAEIFNAVINQGGTPAMLSNTLALRPAFGYRGRIFIATDTREIYRDTGTSWELIGSGGGSVNIYNSDGTLTGNRTVTLDNKFLYFQDNKNGGTSIRVVNTTSGGNADASYIVQSNAGLASFGKRSSVNTGYKILTANVGYSYSDTSFSILADNGSILFAAGGSSTAQMTLTNLGRLLLGTTTDAGFLADFQGGSSRFIRTTISNSGVQILSSAGGVGGLSLNGTTPVSNQMDVSQSFNLYQSNSFSIQGPAIRFSSAQIITSTGSAGVVDITGLMQNTSGSPNIFSNRLNPTYNLSGTFSGNLIGVWHNPTVNSIASGKIIGFQSEIGENNFIHSFPLTASDFTDRNIWTLHARLRQTLTPGADQAGAGYYVGGLHIREISASGNNTFGNATINAGGASTLQIDFTSAGTLTASQSGLRAFSGHQIFNTFGGSASGTITHFAGMQILGLYNRNTGSITPTITNAYGLIVNNLNDYSHTFTLTNRWGVYQTGGSDNNYFAGKLLVGTTTVTARQVHISGNIELTTTLAGTAGGSSGQHLSIWANGNEYKIALLNP